MTVYQATKKFLKEEIYGLTSQLRRSGYSVAANIAEGSAQESREDYLHFLYIARGSLTETQYFFHLACRLAYFDDNAETRCERISRLYSAVVPLSVVRRHLKE